jgi:hypothetical protein
MTILNFSMIGRVANMSEAATETLQNNATNVVTTMGNEASIFAGVFSVDEGVVRRKQEMLTIFNTPAVFKNEWYVFFILTKDFPKVVPHADFIRLYLQTNRAIFQKNPHVEMANYRVGDTDPYVEFVNSCLALFEDCTKRTVDDAEYYRSLEMHKMEYINRQAVQILEESVTILSEGVTYGNKTMSGYSDMRENEKGKFLKLDNMMAKADRRGVVTYGYTDEDEEEDNRIKIVTKFGVELLDEAIGGIYEGDMVSLLAPAKGCKSRFATHVLHNALITGTSIAMWSVENGYKGWEYLVRARHFNWFYNSKVTDATQKRIIDSDMIRKGEMSPELLEMELASWTDLKCNSNYGRIASIDEDMDEDNFTEVLDNATNEVGAKLVCLDYLQLVSGGNKNMSKNERIGEAYKKTLQFCKKKKVGGIFPAQLKQTVVGDIQKVSPEDLINMELRDSAGESYEVIKTPDVNLALYGTVEDIRNGSMKLISIPSRNSAPFEPIDLYVDAGTCTFSSIRKQA